MSRIPSQWEDIVAQNPDHSRWYIERFRAMAREGRDLDGEARLIDALSPRRARILDAGCGPGRVGGRLHELGHTVVGVDVDAALIRAAEEDHPGPTWLVGDLAELDLPARAEEAPGVGEPFDVIVCAGNVMTFLAWQTRREVLRRLAGHLAEGGRAVVGFGAGRGYEFADFRADAKRAGLREDILLAGWDLRPYAGDSDFLVAVLSRA